MDITFVIYTQSKFIERNSGDVIELLQTHSTTQENEQDRRRLRV